MDFALATRTTSLLPPRLTTPRLAEAEALYSRVRGHIPKFEWDSFADDALAIERLKLERDAIVLAHNYQTPEIFHGVADIVGDSLALAREAEKTDASVIVLAGVHFMAETAKILNPSKTVLIPDARAGCSLADSITAADVRALKAAHPGVPVVTYVNTSAEVKAETDVCCTSGNAKKVVESVTREWGANRVIMIPDKYLAANIAAETGIEMITWDGACEVHERFTPADIAEYPRRHAGRGGAGPSRMPARGGAGRRLCRLHRRHGRLCGAAATRQGGDDHRVLHGRQHRRPEPADRVPAALQPVPAHEADHARRHPPCAGDDDHRGAGRPRHRRPRAARGRTHAGDLKVSAMSLHEDGRPVVIGAGVAGLSTALRLAEHGRVTVLCAADLGQQAASAWAQGGVAAAVGADDSPTLHAEDTSAAGDGLCAPEATRRITAEGPPAIERLIALGARFDRTAEGALKLGLEAAHSRRRIVHAQGDGTGREVLRTLIEAARRTRAITVLEGLDARRLLLDAQGAAAGVLAADASGSAVMLRSGAVVLATGGLGGLYAHTTNPAGALGRGLAMAARAGAALTDMEFVQFHPTALDVGLDPMPLVSEAVRGEGAWLVNDLGERFMAGFARAELEPRDVVARAVWAELTAGRRVFLDAREAIGERFASAFPSISAACRAGGRRSGA